MDYVTQSDILLVLRQSGSPQAPRILLEVYDEQDNSIVGEVEGLISGNLSIDASSDIRRTGTIVVSPTRTQNIRIEEGNFVWLNRYVKMKVGLYDIREKTYTWYSMGYYTYQSTSVQYDATTNQLTLQLNDFMAKLNGTLNGNIGYYSMTFAAKPGTHDYWGENNGSTSTAYALTITDYPGYDETNEGEIIGFWAYNTNDASPTININGLGALPILSYRTSEGLEAGRIQLSHPNLLRIETVHKDGIVTKNVYYDSYLEDASDLELKQPSILRNAIITVLEEYASFIGSNYIVDDVGAPRAFASINDNWQTYRDENADLWNTIPYDLEFSAGTTVMNILTTMRDLYSGYFEMFFEPEQNTFICQLIPTCKNDNYFIENDFIQRVLISESTTVDMTTVRNICEVWGKTFEPDFYGTEVTYSGNVYSSYIEGYDDTYYNGDIVALKIPTTNTADAPCLNLHGYGNVTIYDENLYQPVTAGTITGDNTHVFKIEKKRNSETKEDVVRAFHLGMWQVHAMAVLTDGTESPKTHTFSDGTTLQLYSEAYFQKKYNVTRVEFETAADSPFTIQKLGEILDVKTGSDYENISSDDNAVYRAKIENDKNCRLTDSVQITTLLLPFLDVNKKITYKPYNDTAVHEYIIKSISHDFQGFTSSITLERYYEDAV